MNVQRLGIVLTFVNLVLLMFLLVVLGENRQAVAQDTAPVLRGRALEIVDVRGRIRASIKVEPANPTATLPRMIGSGSVPYPETAILRLSDQNGHPGVKIETSDRGSGLYLGGESDPPYVQLGADTNAGLRLTNKEGRALLFKP